MSEKAKGKRKVTETDDEGAEDRDEGRKQRRVTVRDLEETDWVKKVTGFMDRMAEWEERARREQQRVEEERKKTEEAERKRRTEAAWKGTEEPEVVMGDPSACWNCRSRGAECVRQR